MFHKIIKQEPLSLQCSPFYYPVAFVPFIPQTSNNLLEFKIHQFEQSTNVNMNMEINNNEKRFHPSSPNTTNFAFSGILTREMSPKRHCALDSLNAKKEAEEKEIKASIQKYEEINFKDMFIPGEKEDKNMIKMGKWTSEEEDIFLEYIKEDHHKWVKIAKKMGNRTRKQLKDKYNSMMKKRTKIWKFTNIEDNKILFFSHLFMRNWSETAQMIPGRNHNMVKNRFYSKLRKVIS